MTKYAFLERSVDEELGLSKEAAGFWRDLGRAIGSTGNQVAHSLANAGYDTARAGNWILNRLNNNIGPAAWAAPFGADLRLPEARWNEAINRNQQDTDRFYDTGSLGEAAKATRDESAIARNASKALELVAGALATAPAGGAAGKAFSAGARGLGSAGSALAKVAPKAGPVLSRVVNPVAKTLGTIGSHAAGIGTAANVATRAAPAMVGEPGANLKWNGVGARMNWQSPDEYDRELKSILPLAYGGGDDDAAVDRPVRDAEGNPYYATDKDAQQWRQRRDGVYVLPGQEGYDDAKPVELTFSRPTTSNDARRFALLARDLPENYQSQQVGNAFRSSVAGDVLGYDKPWFQSGGPVWDEKRQSYYPFVYPELARNENGEHVQKPWVSRYKHGWIGNHVDSLAGISGQRLDRIANGAAMVGRWTPQAMLADSAGYAAEGRPWEAARGAAGAALVPAMGPISSKIPTMAGRFASNLIPYWLGSSDNESRRSGTVDRGDVDAAKLRSYAADTPVKGVNETFSGMPRDVYEAYVRGLAANELADEGRAPTIFSHPVR